ncbi:MAG: hypothetical protein ACRD1Z_16060, partial [Vicinamibacteria bacterium]
RQDRSTLPVTPRNPPLRVSPVIPSVALTGHPERSEGSRPGFDDSISAQGRLREGSGALDRVADP